MSRTIVRAWTKDGCHRDILILDEQQVRMHFLGVDPPVEWGGGPAMSIDPKKFPEMERFEVIVQP